jgi:WD40 repeat protein
MRYPQALICCIICLKLLTAELSAQEVTLRASCRGHTSNVYDVAISPDGKTLASASCDRTVKLWDVATGKELATLKGHAVDVWCVGFSPDGKLLASGDGDDSKGIIKLWDVGTRSEIASFPDHKAMVKCLAFSKDGTTLASGSWDLTVRRWDVATKKEKAVLRHDTLGLSGVWSLSFSPDGKTLASGSDKVRVWDLQTGKEVFKFGPQFSFGVTSVSHSKDGKMLAASFPGLGVVMLDIENQKEIATIKGPESPAIFAAFRPDGRFAVAWTYDNRIQFFDMPSRKIQGEVKATYPTCMAFSTDGRTLAAGGIDSTISLWDLPVAKAEKQDP